MSEHPVQSAITRKFGLRPRSSWEEDVPRAVSKVLGGRGLPTGTGAKTDLVFSDPTVLRELAGQLTVAETFFFRHKEQLEEAVSHVGTVLGRGRQRPKIWSAGCSTGEEPYSLVMMLTDALGGRAQLVDIVACDINHQALSTARRAVYGDWSLRGVEPELIGRHFAEKHPGKYRVLPAYRERIDFQHLSILEMAATLAPTSIDVVVFRNVGVYLEPSANEACHLAFARILRPNGLLVLAPTDPAPPPTVFARAERGTTSVYCVTHAGTDFGARPALGGTRARTPEGAPDELPHLGAQALLPLTRRVVSERAPAGMPLGELLESPSVQQRQRPSIGPRIAALGNTGRLDEALGLVETLVGSDPTSAKAFLLRAQLHLAGSRSDRAMDDLRRVLFLEPEHRLARYWYAVVLRGMGRTGPALAQLRELERRLGGTDGAATLEDGHTTCADLLRAAEWLRTSTE